MLIKIKRKDAFERYPKFPWHNYETDEWYYPRDCKTGILTLPSNSMEEHAAMLSSSLIKWMKTLNADSFIFMGETETPWLYQDHDHAPVIAAKAYLKENSIGKRFNGALEVTMADMDEFIMHHLWLVKCCAALPIFHFMDKEQSIVCSICQYGSVHFSLLKEDMEKIIAEGDFKIFPHTSCSWPFESKDV